MYQNAEKNTARLHIVLPKSLKNKFVGIIEAQGKNASKVIRNFIEDFVNPAKKGSKRDRNR